jgi:hypothetical protein
MTMDAPDNSHAAAPSSSATGLLDAASHIDLTSKVAIACVFFGWFLLNTLVVTLGSLQHGVRFFDLSAVIADPSRMFFGSPVPLHRLFFIPLCLICLCAPLLPHVRRRRLSWLSYAAPLALMAACGIMLFSRTSGEFIAAPSNAGHIAANLIQFANDLAHRGGDLVARHVSIGIGGYVALAASMVLTLQGIRRVRDAPS